MTSENLPATVAERKARPCGNCKTALVLMDADVESSLASYNRSLVSRGERPIAYSEVLRCPECFALERHARELESGRDYKRFRAVLVRLKENLAVDPSEIRHLMQSSWSDLLRQHLRSTGNTTNREPGEEG